MVGEEFFNVGDVGMEEIECVGVVVFDRLGDVDDV